MCAPITPAPRLKNDYLFTYLFIFILFYFFFLIYLFYFLLGGVVFFRMKKIFISLFFIASIGMEKEDVANREDHQNPSPWWACRLSAGFVVLRPEAGR